MKKIKFNIPICNYKIKYKKSILLPKKLELVKIILGDREFMPNEKIIITKSGSISIMDIYNKKLFTEK